MRRERIARGKRRGSALLAVLGFLAFMVVSAVSFAIYMRAERQPSSVARSNLATGFLVKAALAQAMSRLDDALGDDPYPGVTNANSRVDRRGNAMNWWVGRVFMPPALDGETEPGKPETRYASPEDTGDYPGTVSVLNLEALGHLPPPLINEARYLSRVSHAAKWETLLYDAGQYAFCAVNVSDYFDVNKMEANAARSSSPEHRVGISHLLRDTGSGSISGTQAGQLAGFDAMRSTTPLPDAPYASMLDYNLVLGRSGLTALYSPFFDYIEKSGGAGTLIYKSTVGDNDNVKKAMRQPFIAGSEAGGGAGGGAMQREDIGGVATAVTNVPMMIGRAELDRGEQDEHHPFFDNMQDSRDLTSADIWRSGMPGATEYLQVLRGSRGGTAGKRIRRLDTLMLYDYLDSDDVPCSLGIPSVERIPMVTAINLRNVRVNLKLKAGANAPKQEVVNANNGTVQKTTEVQDYTFEENNILNGALDVMLAYPFKRDGEVVGDYKAQALVRVFLTRENALEKCRVEDLLRPKSTEWTAGSTAPAYSTERNAGPLAVFTYVSGMEPVNIPEGADAGSEKLDDYAATVRFNFMGTQIGNASVPFVQRRQITYAAVAGQPAPNPMPANETKYRMAMGMFDPANGGALAAEVNFREAADFAEDWAEPKKYVQHVAVWVRVLNGNNQVVDMVPALGVDTTSGMATDDQEYGVSGGDTMRHMAFPELQIDGSPLMAISARDEGKHFRFTMQELDNKAFADKEAANSWAARPGGEEIVRLICADPRFNWAPEDWVAEQGSVIDSGSKWDEWLRSKSILGAGGRSPDVFMFVSNAGRLQSMGEFAFLPRVGDWSANNTDNLLFAQPAATMPETFGQTYSRNVAWRTYDSYWNEDAPGMDIGGGDLVKIDAMFDVVDTSASPHPVRFRDAVPPLAVNPYTDSEEVVMGALAGTPYDWWAAALDKDRFLAKFNTLAKFKGKSGGEAAKPGDVRDYTFNDSNDSNGAKLTGDAILEIAKRIKDALRAPENAGTDWQVTWDEVLDWRGNGDPYNFLGVDLRAYGSGPLHSVDRKFLHAFWRGCFANRQQMFLIFVRAEPMALGNAGTKGGRAVALVWRDPQPMEAYSGDKRQYSEDRAPHRMKILYYRRLE